MTEPSNYLIERTNYVNSPSESSSEEESSDESETEDKPMEYGRTEFEGGRTGPLDWSETMVQTLNKNDYESIDSEPNSDIINNLPVSDVWNHFEKIEDLRTMEIKSYKCNLCAKLYKSSCATSTLWRHLNNKHTSIYSNNSRQTTLTSYQFRPYSEAESKHITIRMIEWIIVNLQSFLVVEQNQFHQFVAALNPQYIITCHQTIKDLLINQFVIRHNNIKHDIDNIKSKFALTMDIWTSITKESYLGITAHYINSHWEMKRFLLDIIPLTERHTSDLIISELIKILEDFNMGDNAANMVSAGEKLSNELELRFGNSFFKHYRCVAHIINLAVRHDVDIRWNSTHLMIERFIEIRSIIECLVNNNYEELQDLCLTTSDWKHIGELYHILEPMYEATKLSSSSSYPTMGDVRLAFIGMFTTLDHYLDAQLQQSMIASSISVKLDEYWRIFLDQSPSLSAILGPRTKLTTFG
ncbi:9464_t:CDS:2 [Entrophospora sp. SA101]|nr:9464_t:CDS:2 [Entrophospora sp. SA101]